MASKGERASKKMRRLSTDSEGSEDQGGYDWGQSKGKRAPAPVPTPKPKPHRQHECWLDDIDKQGAAIRLAAECKKLNGDGSAGGTWHTSTSTSTSTNQY
ncbi:hypothetical protein HYALB_00007210 [Hymenoscyphus albidus]|uniref:Uncharacterized protein n=1 Tax=Hymenoscyphus albidus TaxID=595503 RepID=A0A9N9PXH2_9HELO|nr:hypothetical protein HYALB_00007210 [Hymenoscyphus albidus]